MGITRRKSNSSIRTKVGPTGRRNYSVQWPCGPFPKPAIPDLDAGGFRVYRQAGLSVKRTCRKKLLRVGIAQPVLSQPNQEWSLDFVCDALGTGRAVRVLSIVDNFTRE